MTALFYEIGQHGLGYAREHRNELTSMECMELLLAYPESEGFIPFERMNPTAWNYLLRDAETLSPKILEQIPWHWITKKTRRHLKHEYPGILIPAIKPLSGINTKEGIISQFGVFEMARYFVYNDENAPEKSFCVEVSPYGLINSLIEVDPKSNQLFLFGLAYELPLKAVSTHLTPSLIHISISKSDEREEANADANVYIELYITRHFYERIAVKILTDRLHTHWNGFLQDPFDGFHEYPCYDDFVSDVRRLVITRPHLLSLFQKDIQKQLTK